MRAYSTKQLLLVVACTLLLGGLLVAVVRLARDAYLSETDTARTVQSQPDLGTLSLSVAHASEDEVIIDLTFVGRSSAISPGAEWMIWVTDNILGLEPSLPTGLALLEGTLNASCICPVANNILGLEARLKAIADGEWVIYGRLKASHGDGFSMGCTTYGSEITVVNGFLTKLESQQPQDQPSSSPGQPAEKLPESLD